MEPWTHNSQAEGPQIEYFYMPKKPELNKPKFEAILIIRGKKRELTNERKRKMDESYNKQKNRERKMKI